MPRLVEETISFERLLSEMGDSIQVDRGETIYQPGNSSDSVYVVEEGRVKLAYLDESGKKLTEMRLESAPVFDGMAVSEGKIYLTTMDGTLICMGD